MEMPFEKSLTDNNYTDEDKELVKAIPNKVDKAWKRVIYK